MSEVKFNIDVVSAMTFSWNYDLIQLRKIIQKGIQNITLEVQWIVKNCKCEIVL
jgi:hypothetical protein